MDLVDQCCPLVDSIAQEAARLQQLARAPGPEQSGARAAIDVFLGQSAGHMQTVRARLGDVLLAQGYQDLSGQIIRSVMTLVDELEVALSDLVRIGGLANGGGEARRPVAGASLGHGPVVPGVEHGDTVGGQDDIDAMLSGLGM
jgi:chemotaxis protein CheZ